MVKSLKKKPPQNHSPPSLHYSPFLSKEEIMVKATSCAWTLTEDST